MTFATDAPTADTGPGFLAFVAFFLLALALWFLMRNMNARMRRMSYRQQQAGRGKNDPQASGTEADRPTSGDPDRPDPDRPDAAGDDPGHGSDGGGRGGA